MHPLQFFYYKEVYIMFMSGNLIDRYHVERFRQLSIDYQIEGK